MSLLLLSLWGCRGGGDRPTPDDSAQHTGLVDTATPCTWTLGEERRERTTTLDGLDLWIAGDLEPTQTEVVSVIVHGGMATEQAPPSERFVLNPGADVLQIHSDMPADANGGESRTHLARVLAFAAGQMPDDEGCGLRDVAPDTHGLILVGLSMGGNLTVATLALEKVPTVDALLTWETPASAPFNSREYHMPERGPCTLVDGTLACEMDYSLLSWDGAAFLDRNRDGDLDEEEPSWTGLEIDGFYYVSPPMRRRLLAMEDQIDGLASLDATERFWDAREGAALAAKALEALPELKVMVIGGTKDHVQPFKDGAHVFGMAEAFGAAPWVRVNPDAAYSGEEKENPAGEGVTLAEPGALIPGTTGTPQVGQGVHELADRIRADDWSADLDAPL